MKSYAALFFLAAGLAAPSAAEHAETSMNPISRVVQLLQGLAKKVEADGKEMQEVFETYQCWYKTVVAAKKASNAAASDRISSLEAYIDDIESGRIEFTTERADLEKQVAELQGAIEEATNLRDKEHEDYVAAKEEMSQAVAALEEAVQVLGEVNKEGSMLGIKFDLRHVLALSRNILDKGDLQYMEHVLDGDVPNPDWKKLNRKATFKMKYSPRSKKIHKILADLLQTFKDNLADAEEKETASKAAFDKLMESKNKELETSQAALTDMVKEGGARGLSKTEAQQEVDDLKDQISADEGFLTDTETGYKEKLEEYKERKKLVTAEVGAISEAISVLHSDDARDTFKKSFESQGYLLLQQTDRSMWRSRARRAAAAVRRAGVFAQDSRLSALAAKVLLQEGGRFDKVLEAIDKMVTKLQDEEKEDLSTKEDCETKRMDKTKEARTVSLEIDEVAEEIERLKSKIVEQKQQIALTQEEIKKDEEDLKEATQQREDQNTFYLRNKSDDEDAVDLIQRAMDVLKEHYASNAFVQSQREPPVVTAGEAPPPPPATWDEPYAGGKDASKGIQSILGMIKEDVEKDLKKAEDGEKQAVEEFEKAKADLEKAIDDGKAKISDAEGVISDSEGEISSQKEIKTGKMESLDATMKELKAMQPGCDFISVNFEVRTKNRQLEIDGLKKAKAILEGAAFPEAADPNREIKPGDAFFLQRH